MYIVTGGAGFIGSVVVKKLNDEGISDILIIDNLEESEKWKNLQGKRFHNYINKEDFFNILVHEFEDFAADKNLAGIIHLGACSDTTEKDMDYLWNNNVQFSKLLCKFALYRNARFIYASSAATYGAGEQGYDDDIEKLDALKPLNRYGYSKHAFDLWAKRNGYLKEVVGLKFFNVYGPNEYHKGFMTSVPYNSYFQVRDEGMVKLFKSYRSDYKDGEQKRDFIYVKDCAEVIYWLLKNPAVNGLFNLGTGKARAWNDLAGAVFTALQKEPRISYIEMPGHLQRQYQYFTEARMDRLTKAGCPVKFHSVEEGILDYVRGHLHQDDPYL